MEIPQEIIEQFTRGNGAIFIGSGLSIDAGFPDWNSLIRKLAEEIDNCPEGASNQEIAQFYEFKYGRHLLNEKLKDILNTHHTSPTKVHEALFRLPINLVFTTNYDDLLEKTLRLNNSEFNLIVTDEQISLLRSDRKQIIKLHGDLTYSKTLTVTSGDYEKYYRVNPSITRLLATSMQTRTVLFLGYSAKDINLNFILSQIRSEVGPFARNLYTIQFGLNLWEKEELKRKGLSCIDLGLEGSKQDLLYDWINELHDHISLYSHKNDMEILTIDDSSYRNWLFVYTDYIDIRGIGAGKGRQANRFPLLDLYIDLYVYKGDSNSNPREEVEIFEEREPLINVVENSRCVIILGDPGTGKTTFLHYLARTYIVDTNKPLPLLVRFPDLFSHITKNQNKGNLKDFFGQSHRNWLISYWLEQSDFFGWGFNKSWLTSQFQQGKVFVLLDGLDELPTHEERVRIIEMIDSAAQYWSNCHWVLTSRPGVVKGKAIPLDFSEYIIASLGDEEIRSFLNAWVKLLYQNQVKKNVKDFQSDQYLIDLNHAICGRLDVLRFARNPVMLTAIAIVHWNEKKLPEGKAELYEAIIQWLIKNRRGLNIKDEKTTRKCYQLLSLEMFLHPQGRQTQQERGWAAEKIAPYFDGKTKEEKIEAALVFLTQEEIDTGIIILRGEGNFAFRHLSFQEYLAAYEVASKIDDENTGWWKIIKDKLEIAEWYEMIRFIPAILSKIGDSRPALFIKRVSNTRQNTKSILETLRLMSFLKDILLDISVYNCMYTDVEELIQAKELTMEIFTEEGLKFDLQFRYDAAIALGRCGDPRFMDLEKNWIYIPGGKLQIGAQREDASLPNYDEYAEEEEQPVHQVYTASFEIGKYPVTIQEYARFIKDNGYDDRSLWDAEGWEWREKEQISLPQNWDMQLPYPNCPVTYISWYEAKAYCNWLEAHDNKMNYRLPTEAEWEYTVRLGQKNYSRYCFGNTSPLDLKDEINWDFIGGRLRRDHLAPVGLFPLDTTQNGVKDMNGNIREWTFDPGSFDYKSEPTQASTIYDHSSDLRVVRGGSWNFNARSCRSASRTRIKPYFRYFDVGFRVIRTPKPIPIKGKIPENKYKFSLGDIFAKYTNCIFSREQTNKKLLEYNNRFSRLSTRIADDIFPEKKCKESKKFDRLPCTMGNAKLSKLDYNLLYQDTRIKIAVEEKLKNHNEISLYAKDINDLMEIASILLHTTGNNKKPLWEEMTDNDLDAIIYKILEDYDSNRCERLLKDGYRANELALNVLSSLNNLSLRELMHYQIFAGTVWWNDQDFLIKEQFTEKLKFAIYDFDLFVKDVLSKECHMLFFFDDNGELVWDLAIILHLLNQNPQLRVTGVINNKIIANNANIHTLTKCLDHYKLEKLKALNRFIIFKEDNPRSSIDLSYCSESLLNLLHSGDLAFIKGTAAFETMQGLPIDTYYAFVVYGADSQKYTGLQEGEGVLVHIPKRKFGYRYNQITLREIYSQLKV